MNVLGPTKKVGKTRHRSDLRRCETELFGRKLRQHKVLSTELGDYIDRVVRNFVKQRNEGERFATWALRADEADLR